MSLQEKFNAAVEYVRKPPKDGAFQASNDDKLKFYSHFKQATEGPCKGSRPGIIHQVNRAKWDAWNELGDMSKEDAMQGYVNLLDKIKS